MNGIQSSKKRFVTNDVYILSFNENYTFRHFSKYLLGIKSILSSFCWGYFWWKCIAKKMAYDKRCILDRTQMNRKKQKSSASWNKNYIFARIKTKYYGALEL